MIETEQHIINSTQQTLPNNNISNNIKKNREWDILEIATHNINGIRGDRLKLLNLLKWEKKEKIKIMGISDTNIDSKQGIHINKNKIEHLGYKGYWSSRANKTSGSDMAIFVDDIWAKHVSSVKQKGSYYIEVTLMFKGINIRIIQLYALLNNKAVTKQLAA